MKPLPSWAWGVGLAAVAVFQYLTTKSAPNVLFSLAIGTALGYGVTWLVAGWFGAKDKRTYENIFQILFVPWGISALGGFLATYSTIIGLVALLLTIVAWFWVVMHVFGFDFGKTFGFLVVEILIAGAVGFVLVLIFVVFFGFSMAGLMGGFLGGMEVTGGLDSLQDIQKQLELIQPSLEGAGEVPAALQ